jgi:CBS-domain-containing membrane protein
MRAIFEGREKLAPKPNIVALLRTLIGASSSIAFLLALSYWSGYMWIMASFGASCVLIYAVSDSPLAQPRNIIFGHIISSIIGLCALKLFGHGLLVTALAVAVAICAMQYFRCVHPPAGANPLLIMLTAAYINYDWWFLIFPVLTGSIVLVLIAYLVNNFKNMKAWPISGLGLLNTQIKKNPNQ